MSDRREVPPKGTWSAAANEPLETVNAIRSGEVDAFVVGAEGRERILVLSPAHPPWRLIVEEMAQGAVTLTRDGDVAYCNPEFARMVGRNRQDILGHHFKEFVAGGSRAALHELITSLTDARAELDLEAADGSKVPVIAARNVLPDDEEARCCMVFADLREQRAREQLRSAKEAAEEASKMKDEFLAMASHELRTPLTSILGWAQHVLAISDLDEETARRAVGSIQQSAKTLGKLVDDILDSSRLSSRKLSLEAEELDLRHLVRSVFDLMNLDLESRHLTLTLDLPEEEVIVRGDPGRLQQVLVNLVSNAARHSSPGGMIIVRVAASGETCQLVVQDYGEGIDATFLPHLFEAFRQGDPERSHRGLGLGLWIVQQLVEAHGGSVIAGSPGKGQGATFTIELPLAR